VPQTDSPNARIYIDVFSMEFYSESVGTRVWLCDDCTSNIDQCDRIHCCCYGWRAALQQRTVGMIDKGK